MKIKIISATFTILVLLAVASLANSKEQISSLVKKVQLSTVMIIPYDAQGNELGQGSGFFVSKKGEILTNWHVIKDACSAIIKTSSGAIYKIKGVVSKDANKDIANILVDANDVDFQGLFLSKTLPKIGDRVIVVGNPLGLEATVSDGLVAGLRKTEDRGTLVQISAPISPGSSGSPVINTSGHVVGIATFQMTKGQNLNFAVSVSDIRGLSRNVQPQVLSFSCEKDGKRSSSSRVNQQVQLKENEWLKIVNEFVVEKSAAEFYKVEENHPLAKIEDKYRELYIKIQFLKPCRATINQEIMDQYNREVENAFKLHRPLSAKSQAIFMLKLGSLSAAQSKDIQATYRAYEDFCEKNNIDSSQLFDEIAIPKYRCNYKTTVFITYFSSKDVEIKTDHKIPIAWLINASSEERKIDILPGETTWVTFFIPREANGWYSWVPK